MKQIQVILSLFCFLLSSNPTHAAKLDQMGVIVDRKGYPKYYSWKQAIKACPKGTHLATAWDYTQNLRDQGTLVLQYPSWDPNNSNFSQYKVSAKDLDGSKYVMYLDTTNFKNPLGIFAYAGFWTSSVQPDSNRPWFYYGRYGRFLLPNTEDDEMFVQCLEDCPRWDIPCKY